MVSAPLYVCFWADLIVTARVPPRLHTHLVRLLSILDARCSIERNASRGYDAAGRTNVVWLVLQGITTRTAANIAAIVSTRRNTIGRLGSRTRSRARLGRGST
ncbi:hypothetical protein C8Q76DRAFT_735069 [Earliella scabrosa]|nr:hypothetical protein C8Q76DRAFT_735069 [Earliella scabrosa]